MRGETNEQALRDFDSLPGAALVRAPVAARLLSVSEATLWRRVKDGTLPQPVKPTKGVTGWKVADLRRLLRS